jgi:hydrogenase nickel incorporation protein HypB
VTEIDVRQKVLAANAAAAQVLRDAFLASGTLVVNLISSPGSGKTTLLEATARALKERFRLGGLDGDIATERDAERLRRSGIPARQILTGGACHLDARQVEKALAEEGEIFSGLDVLFIENVGNLICPTSYDLGEDFKVVLLSVVEGDDKPFKYPAIFSRAAVTVVTKADLLPHVDFDLEAVRQQVATLNPSGRFLVTSARSGNGMDSWFILLEEEIRRKRAASPPGAGIGPDSSNPANW